MKATALRSLFVIAGLGGSPKILGKPGETLKKFSGESGIWVCKISGESGNVFVCC